jgi:glycosyltransferase involved in cell wall biosynthesis
MSTLPISVIIPTYNRAHLIGRAIDSVLAAVAPDDEVLVVDDASSDDTEAVLAKYGSRVRHVRVPHGGAGAARNHGVEFARHPLIAFQDSDDTWAPDKLELQRRLMEARPDLVFCFSDMMVCEASGKVFHNYLTHWHRDARSWDEILGPGVPFSSLGRLPAGRADFKVHIGDMFLPEMESDYIATLTVLVRRELAGAALWFAEDLPVSEDKECFARLAQVGLAAYLDCETACQHGHDGWRLTDANLFTLATARLTLLERIWGRDEAFLSQYGDRFAAAVRGQHRKRAHWLLARGRTNEARAELRQSGSSPLSYRLLSHLPGPVVRGMLGLRRLFKRETAG